MKRFLLVVVLLFGLAHSGAAPLGAGPVSATEAETQQVEPPAEISAEDAVAIHDTVRAQLDALARDDADAAFALTTLEKRELIGSAGNFLWLMRELFAPLYRNKALIFAEPEVVQGMAVQAVRITDLHSRVWVAVFWMLQEGDARWRIDDYHLLETASVSL